MDMQAAIGIHQIKRVEGKWLRRKELWKKYNAALAGLGIGLPAEPATQTRHDYHLYTTLIYERKTGVTRDAFLGAITVLNIGVGAHYLSVAEHAYYQSTFGWKPEDYHRAMSIGRQTVNLPLSAKLTDADVNNIVQTAKLSVKK